uniref:Spermatosis associated 22 n=1 Tax=Coturnix japonica TaxID=93934 RepID=A0A8C2U0N0_COTJA
MKRSSADTSTRSTAGCLPVPLFNQKKRTRQPLTSNPLKNEPGSSSCVMAALYMDKFVCSLNLKRYQMLKLEQYILLLYTVIAYLSIQGRCRYCRTESYLTLHCRAEEKTPSTKIWNRNERTPASNRAGSISDSGTTQKFESRSNNWKPRQQQKIPNSSNSSQHIKVTESSQTRSTKGQWPVKPNYMNTYMLLEVFKCISLTQVFILLWKDISSFQLKLKEKRNSLRIISAVIESMKHWSQYSYKTALLFEVLGTLDSAVTSGGYRAKNFLLRDGEESLPCVFYEIDRELPRLIRGRVLRCMGNYDAKRNIFKCVSVRPATIPEQNTFQEFVKIADAEMTAYVKTMNEI